MVIEYIEIDLFLFLLALHHHLLELRVRQRKISSKLVRPFLEVLLFTIETLRWIEFETTR